MTIPVVKKKGLNKKSTTRKRTLPVECPAEKDYLPMQYLNGAVAPAARKKGQVPGDKP